MSDLDQPPPSPGYEESGAARHVEVLYDYSYNNEELGDVSITVGDCFRLVAETNEEWWEVCNENNDFCFFVPAQYVRVIESHADANSKKNDYGNKDGLIPTDPSVSEDGSDKSGTQERKTSLASTGLPAPEVFYANLDEYRASANIPQPPKTLDLNSPDDEPAGEYASLAFVQNAIHPPSIEQGEYLHVLLEPLPWDVYRDNYSKREFYYNRETKECTWKPPRKSKSPASPPPEMALEESGESKRKPPTLIKANKTATNASAIIDGCKRTAYLDEYLQTEEEGEVIFINKKNNEKWKRVYDDNNAEFYISLSTSEKVWELPSQLSRKISFIPKIEEPANGEIPEKANKFSSSLPRHSKSKSVHGGDPQSLPQGPRSSFTLPPNFSPNLQQSKSNDCLRPSASVRLPSKSNNQQQASDKPFGALFNTSKIVGSGKKIKKNWSSSYLVLKGSNLVFYKDEKTSSLKAPGSPHGKTDAVVNVQGAKIELNPKDLTSKKNVLLVSASNGCKYLLQADEKTVLSWSAQLLLISGNPAESTSPASKDDKKGVPRSISVDDNSSGRNVWTIRSKLLSLMRSRPLQEDLVKRGIIKDAVFGALLKNLCDKEHTKVPKFVTACIAAVENRGLDHDGIYRISGNLAEIQKLRYVVDKDESYNLDDKQWDVHVLTGSLKLFFRELKEPLLTFELFDKMAAAVQKEVYNERLKAMKEIMPELPRCNYETMKKLFQHLILVTKESKQNRMQIHNLAIVFGPTLSWKNDADAHNLAVLTVFQSRIVEFMLLEYERLFIK